GGGGGRGGSSEGSGPWISETVSSMDGKSESGEFTTQCEPKKENETATPATTPTTTPLLRHAAFDKTCRAQRRCPRIPFCVTAHGSKLLSLARLRGQLPHNTTPVTARMQAY
ncbi:hypothetical protein B296_00056249, partial [Ensete ventricosum]